MSAVIIIQFLTLFFLLPGRIVQAAGRGLVWFKIFYQVISPNKARHAPRIKLSVYFHPSVTRRGGWEGNVKKSLS